MTQRFDVLAFGAHPDDVEVAMGGTIAKLSDKGLTTLLVDLCDGEPTRHASRGARQRSSRRGRPDSGCDATDTRLRGPIDSGHR